MMLKGRKLKCQKVIVLVLAVMFILSCIPQTIIRAASKTLDSCDFEKGIPKNWSTKGNAFKVVKDANGNSILQQPIASSSEVWASGSDAWTDYYIEADYIPTEFVENGGNSIFIRGAGAGTTYLAFMKDKSIDLARKNAFAQTSLGKVSYTFEINKSYRLRFVAVGSTIEFYINGEKLISVEDKGSDLLANGNAGLSTWKSAMQLDNIAIGTATAATMAPDASSSKPAAVAAAATPVAPTAAPTPAAPATPTAAPTLAAPVVPGKTYILSDFEDNKIEPWRQAPAAWKIVQSETAKGEMVIEQPLTAGTQDLYLDQEFTDFTYEVQYTPLQTGGGCSLLFRSENGQHGYLLYMTKTSATFTKKGDPAIPEQNGNVASPVNYTFETGVTYTIKVTAKGSLFDIFINGSKVLSKEDTAFTSGKVGLECWKSSAQFDKIRVSDPDPEIAVSGIALKEKELVMAVGESYRLNASTVPENATDKAIGWTTTNSTVLKLKDGEIYATAPGTATIKATTKSGDFSESCTVTVYDKKFSDTKDHWAKKEVEYMASKQIIKGASDDEFAPEANITRAEFLALVVRAFGIEQPKYSGSLTDVTADNWFADAVQAGISANIIDKAMTEGNQFRPEQSITREEMTSMIVNAYKKVTGKNIDGADLGVFADKGDITAWAADYVKQALSLGVIKGVTENSFAPKENVTRAQAAVILYRLYRLVEINEPALAQKVSELEDAVFKLKTKLSQFNGQELAPQEILITKGVAEMFLQFVYQDIDCGRRELALTETNDSITITNDAIAKLDSGDYALTAVKSASGATITKDGGIVNKQGEPLFLRGVVWIESHLSPARQEGIDFMKSLGLNIYNPAIKTQDQYFPSENVARTFNDVEADTIKLFNILHSNGMVLDVMLQTGTPASWFVKNHPEAKQTSGNHFITADIDNPEVRDLMEKHIKAYVDGLKGLDKEMVKDTLFSIDLGNEHRFGSISDWTIKNWVPDLQAKYQTIQALNAAWGKSYASFDDIQKGRAFELEIEGNRAMLYDYTLYSQKRFNNYMKWLKDTFNKYGADDYVFNTFAKFEEGGALFEESNYTLRSRIDLETMAQNLDMMGTDIGNPPRVSDRYSIEWFKQMFIFDYYKSCQPNKTIFDPEWHSIEGLNYKDAGSPKDAIRACIRQGAWHGLNGTEMWVYVRPTSTQWAFTNTTPFANPFMVNAYTTEALTIENEMERIRPFQNAERDIQILYSSTSHVRQADAYFDGIRNLYEAFYFKDANDGFVTENQLSDDSYINNHNFKLIVVPNAQFIQKSAFEGLKKLAAKGVPIVLVGDSLKFDEDGKPITEEITGSSVKKIVAGTLDNYIKQSEDILKFASFKREYTLVAADGSHPEAVEARFATLGDTKLGYAINVGKENRTFKVVDASGNAVQIKEFKNGKLSEAKSEITLEPRGYISFDIVK